MSIGGLCVWANLHKITVPTLIMHAREDDIASLRSADFVEAHISSVCVKKIILENSYHIITMDHDKDVVVKETLDFVGNSMLDGHNTIAP